MKKEVSFGGFWGRNLVITVVIAILFASVLFTYYGMLYSETRQKMIKSQELSAVAEAEQIDKYLSIGIYSMRFACFTLDNMIRDGKSQSEIKDFIQDQSEAIINVMSDNSDGLYGYVNGQFLDGTGWQPEGEFDPVDRPWYIDARANIGRVAIVDPYFDVESKTMTISLAKTLCDAKSVVAMDFSLEYMQKLTEKLSTQRNSDMDMVLDRKYTVITHSDKKERGKNYISESGTFGSALAKKLRSTNESYVSMEYHGAEYIVYRLRVANDWLCVSVFDATSVFRQMKTTLFFTIFAVCLVVVVVFVIMLVLNRKMQIAEQLESDIMEKDNQIKKISKATYRDSLTGVRNKAAFQKLSEEITAGIQKGGGESFAIIMMDVNNLKYINDAFGHSAGDDYLRNCCKILCNIYKHSPIFRIGGDEFVAVLRNTDYENRQHLTGELREAFRQAYEKEESEPWERCSASVGAADYKEGDISASQVFERADQEMYEKKKAFKAEHGSYR